MSKSKYDNTTKSVVLDSKLLSEITAIKKELYYNNLVSFPDYETGVVIETTLNTDWCDYVYKIRANDLYDCAFLLLQSKKKKAQKVRDKIAELVLNNNAIFLTLTFRDDVLESTSPETRRRYVARFLKSVSGQYAANIDFSPDLEREHYHAVITKRIDLNTWRYGFAYAEKVRCHNNDLTRVSKYITKLTNHALKINATRLIYSRL